MAYFNTCPFCGSNLDPGEKCDCDKTENAEKKAPRANTHGAYLAKRNLRRNTLPMAVGYAGGRFR